MEKVVVNKGETVRFSYGRISVETPFGIMDGVAHVVEALGRKFQRYERECWLDVETGDFVDLQIEGFRL